MGGARRDEEKARAKERFFSHRDRFGQWDPKNQRPELWNLFNPRHRPGEHVRVFPLSMVVAGRPLPDREAVVQIQPDRLDGPMHWSFAVRAVWVEFHFKSSFNDDAS